MSLFGRAARTVAAAAATAPRVAAPRAAVPCHAQPHRALFSIDGAAQVLGHKKRRTVINKLIAGTYQPRAEEFHAQLVNGKWNKPKRSARMRAKMKKTMAVHGIEGWHAEFEPTRAQTLARPPKGHRHALEQKGRIEKIKKNMAEMPERIAAYRKEIRDARPPPGLRGWLQKKDN